MPSTYLSFAECDVCTMGKARRLQHNHHRPLREILEVVSIDLIGPWDEPDATSSGVNDRYVCTIIGNYIDMIWAIPCRTQVESSRPCH